MVEESRHLAAEKLKKKATPSITWVSVVKGQGYKYNFISYIKRLTAE